MAPPPHAGQVHLRGAANYEVARLTEVLNGIGSERVGELLHYHGFDGPVPYSGTPTRGDAVHVALLLLRQHLRALGKVR